MSVIWTRALASNATGNQGFGFRQAAGALSAGGGQVRVTFNASPSQGLTTTHCSIGVQGAATAPSMTTNPPVELLFGGVSGFAIPAGGTITSDWMVLSFQSTDTLIIDFDIATGGPFGVAFASGVSGGYFKSGATDWNTSSVAGYTNSGNSYCVSQIEALAAVGAGAAAGVATASGVGASIAQGRGASAGAGGAAGVGVELDPAAGHSAGSATAAGVGHMIAAGAGHSAGAASGNAPGIAAIENASLVVATALLSADSMTDAEIMLADTAARLVYAIEMAPWALSDRS